MKDAHERMTEELTKSLNDLILRTPTGRDREALTGINLIVKKMQSDLAAANEMLRVAEEGLEHISGEKYYQHLGPAGNLSVASYTLSRLRENAEGGGE